MKPGILLLTIFSFLVQLSSQTFEETINFADKQYNLANYQLAVKEYQRALYFSNGIKVDYLYRQIAHSFFKNQQFSQANYFYDLSYKSTINDSLKSEIIFNKSQCFLLSGDYKRSVYELTGLGNKLSDYFEDKRNFYYGVSYFGLEEFKKSEEYFLLLVNEDSGSYQEIKELFSLKKNLYKPNPITAKTLSMILPGSGQIYSGDFKNGFNSILLTGGLATLGVLMYNQYSLLDAILTVFPWFFRYYQGGYEKVKNIAHDKRAIRRDKTYKKVLEIINESKKKL
jgi:hypothetical protein